MAGWDALLSAAPAPLKVSSGFTGLERWRLALAGVSVSVEALARRWPVDPSAPEGRRLYNFEFKIGDEVKDVETGQRGRVGMLVIDSVGLGYSVSFYNKIKGRRLFLKRAGEIRLVETLPLGPLPELAEK